MATRKKVTSETGAYMSQYDQEVEKRLKALEAKNAAAAPAAPAADSSELAALKAKVDLIEKILKLQPTINFDKLAERLGG
jgi:hypothetical protein|tara:strand:- start:881 stop:1120 length:240 start_codon:yes stop_codon:yes gene_type:complete